MPTKSHPSSESKTTPRREIVKVVVVDEGPRGCIKQKATYKDFDDVCRKAKKVNLMDRKLTETKEDRIIFEKKESPYSIPTFKIIIDDSLGFSISAFGWLLPETHDLYMDNYRSIRTITLSSLLQDCNSLTMCKGIQNGQYSTAKRHVVPKEEDPLGVDSTDEESEITFKQSDSLEFFRSRH